MYCRRPTIIQENGTFFNFYCSPGGFAPANNSGVVAWDVIRLATSSDGRNWSAAVVALEPSTHYDRSSVCDPSIIKFKGSYFLYHTCINTCAGDSTAPPDHYHQNRICVALADNVRGPYRKVVTPVIEDLSCAPAARPARNPPPAMYSARSYHHGWDHATLSLCQAHLRTAC